MQMDDISLLKLTELCNVRACVCKVDLKQMLTRKATTEEDDKTLPQEMPVEHRRLGESYDGKHVTLLVAHQHLCLDTIVIQRHHQTIGSNGCTTCPLTRIYD